MHAPRKPHVLIGLTFDIHLLARGPINALVLSLHVFGAERLLSPIGEGRPQNMKGIESQDLWVSILINTKRQKKLKIKKSN